MRLEAEFCLGRRAARATRPHPLPLFRRRGETLGLAHASPLVSRPRVSALQPYSTQKVPGRLPKMNCETCAVAVNAIRALVQTDRCFQKLTASGRRHKGACLLPSSRASSPRTQALNVADGTCGDAGEQGARSGGEREMGQENILNPSSQRSDADSYACCNRLQQMHTLSRHPSPKNTQKNRRFSRGKPRRDPLCVAKMKAGTVVGRHRDLTNFATVPPCATKIQGESISSEARGR